MKSLNWLINFILSIFLHTHISKASILFQSVLHVVKVSRTVTSYGQKIRTTVYRYCRVLLFSILRVKFCINYKLRFHITFCISFVFGYQLFFLLTVYEHSNPPKMNILLIHSFSLVCNFPLVLDNSIVRRFPLPTTQSLARKYSKL